jgi:hypothetical protein
MKCPRCYALMAPGDAACLTCGGSSAIASRAAGLNGTSTPAWVYLFAVACGLIPVVALGGVIPMGLGFGGASSCLAVARATSVPLILRLFACIGITIASWFIFGVFFAAVVAATHR